MNRETLTHRILSKQSYLCVGLDTDPQLVPRFLKGLADPVFEFNKRIIDATQEYCVAYKINTAFYEISGSAGWESMQKTVDYIPSSHFKIADAKRGDIGNTSSMYARAFFETMSFDAITVAPYMGEDSIRPFLEYKGKWTIVLGLTSNSGAADFELKAHDGGRLFESVISKVSGWGSIENLMFVAGATQAEQFSRIREIVPDHFLLVPGVGAQGGSLKEISERALNKDGGLLVNASRAIIFAGSGEDFAVRAGEIARGYAKEMNAHLRGLL